MLLSCTLLTDVGGVNSFREVPVLRMTEGDTITVYLQLRDLAVNTAAEGYNPVGRRFIPAADATLQVTLDSLDDAKKIVKNATQPFAQDPSIWSFTVLATDVVRGSKNLKLVLVEGAKTTRGMAQGAIHAAPLDGLSK